MKSTLASIGKNLILMAVLSLSVVNYVTPVFNWKDLLIIQSIAGATYIFLSSYEYLNAAYKASLPLHRYAYFTNSYFMFRALKTGLFISFGVLLMLSSNRVMYLAPICFIISATEILNTALKFRRKLCFVTLYANYILILQNTMEKVFASEILIVEFRHDIFYFVKKNRKTVQIHLEHISDTENFLLNIHGWIMRNKVMLSEESRTKIEELIIH
ncbi:MAG TPA: hypothetical protein PLQ93_06340 [Bacteroidia bacterium]|nr:hypothetical protein [Bacteroidia bacterium]